MSPNPPIQITAALPGLVVPDGPFEVLATTTSPGTATGTDSSNVTWYCWSKDVVIPAAKWQVASLALTPPSFRMTLARVLEGGGPIYTFLNDPAQCKKPLGSPSMTNAAPCAVLPNLSGASGAAPGAIRLYATQR